MKKHFEELPNPVDMISLQEVVPEISGILESMCVAEVTMVVRNLPGASLQEWMRFRWRFGRQWTRLEICS